MLSVPGAIVGVVYKRSKGYTKLTICRDVLQLVYQHISGLQGGKNMLRIQSRPSLLKLCISCTLCLNHVPLSYPLLLCSPPSTLLLQCYCFSPSQWVLTACLYNRDSSSTVLMVWLMVHQQVKQQHSLSPKYGSKCTVLSVY